MIDEQPRNVEQTREPGHHKYEVQRFYIGIQQLTFFRCYIRMAPMPFSQSLALKLGISEFISASARRFNPTHCASNSAFLSFDG